MRVPNTFLHEFIFQYILIIEVGDEILVSVTWRALTLMIKLYNTEK